jgi:hydrophobic/amphiphilic exporter-1 (mainly G- bacteria), HAE1 family
MSLPRLAIRRPVAVAMLFLGVILLGTISLQRLPIDLLPDVSYPQLVVHTGDPGSAPAEVERFVTEPIEQQVAAVPGVQRVESVTREGVSLVIARFAWGTDMDFAALAVRERLDNLRGQLPELASTPTVLRTDPRSEPVMALSVTGPGDLRDLKEIAEQVFKRRLEQLDGVAQAAVTGGLEREIQVEVDPRLLESHGLAVSDVSAALAAANVSAPGGTVLRGRYQYPLRTLGEFTAVEQIGAVTVGGGRGEERGEGGRAVVLLRDVARVTDGVRERESIARHSRVEPGEAPRAAEAVGLLVFKTAGANTVRVAERVERTLDELRAEFPEVRLEVAMDQSAFISDAISNVLQALVLGGVLAFLVLFLFLRDARYPVAIALAIPISVVGTFALLDASGVTLNIMSLGGLALGVGMLVDNSIVVLENIFRHREQGKSAAEAAALGAGEVQGAITASTLTTVSVFLPIVYVEGVAGELFGALSLAVAFSLLTSLVVALTLLPMLAARWDTDAADAGPLRRLIVRLGRGATRGVGRLTARPLAAFDRGFARFADAYHGLLERALERRGRVVATAALLLGAAAVVAALLPRAVLPEVDQGGFRARLELPRGTPLERTAEAAARLESVVAAEPGVEAVFTRAGRLGAVAGVGTEESGLHTARLEVRLAEGVSTAAVVERLRPRLEAEFGGAVAVETGRATALGQLLGGEAADLAVRVRGEDLDLALAHAQQVQARLAGVAALTNLRLGTELGQPEVRVEIDRERAASYGIEPRRVAQTVEQSMRGVEATQFVHFDRRVPVIVRLPEAERRSLATLEVLEVDGVPLRELVRLHPDIGPAEIQRREQSRVVAVHADVASGGLDRALAATAAALADLPPPAGLRVEVGGENEEMRKSFRELGFAFLLALLLVYMILAAQFESLVHPFTILLSVPLAVVGAVAALAIAGAGLNTMSLIGVVILVGIVVNDAIIKVDLINQLRRAGAPLRVAILEAGRARLRPILMTTVTTVLALLPMALGIGRGADLRAPLAVAVIGGLAVATLLTLIVIPVAYDLVESARARVGGSGRSSEPAAPTDRRPEAPPALQTAGRG